jgi:hypothetical protein
MPVGRAFALADLASVEQRVSSGDLHGKAVLTSRLTRKRLPRRRLACTPNAAQAGT